LRNDRPQGPLAGVKVADLSSFAVGPWATALLGVLGADVIKVENPQGDPLRAVMPTKSGIPTTSATVNFNKRSVVLDFKDPEQLGLAQCLAAHAEILVENYRPGVMDRLGLGYGDVAKRNPGILYVSSSSFGIRGPLALVGSTDQQGQAFSGYASLSGAPGERAEVNRHVAQIDLTTSLYVVQAALAGLFSRRKTGEGQHIRTSQMHAAISVQASRLGHYFATGRAPRPMGTSVPHICPSQAFQARDGRWVNVSVVRPRQWPLLCDALGLSELASDPRFSSNAVRVANRAALLPALELAFRRAEATHWLQRLADVGVPSGPYLTYDDLRFHQVAVSEQLFQNVSLWPAGVLHTAAPPYRFPGSELRHSVALEPARDGQEIISALASGQWPDRREGHVRSA
jgi:crotonobetainyl-CoA:carnitine CoA-transferase CaiB-like acyl-CoA transferase